MGIPTLDLESSLAKQGKPCETSTKKSLLQTLKKADPTTQRKYEERCKQVPEGRSFALRRAVDNIAAQMAGGRLL